MNQADLKVRSTTTEFSEQDIYKITEFLDKDKRLIIDLKIRQIRYENKQLLIRGKLNIEINNDRYAGSDI